MFNKYYDVIFKIGDVDYSQSVTSVSIINDINFIYPAYKIRFFLDSVVTSVEQINGKDLCSLTVSLVTENEENFNIEIADEQLLITRVSTNLQSINHASEQATEFDHPVSTPVEIVAIPKSSFILMNKTVNYLFSTKNQRSPIGAIKTLLEKFSPNVKTDIIEQNSNQEVLEQLIIPAQTFNQSIRYLDYLYGIFNGPMFMYARSYDDTFQLWDLNEKLKQTPAYEAHFLSLGAEDLETIQTASSVDDKYFINSDYLRVNFKQNQKFILGGYNHKYIIKPRTEFYKVIDKSSGDIFKNSVTDINKNTEINDVIESRITVHNYLVGLEEEDSYINSKISRFLANGINISFSLDRNISVNTLSKVGVPISILTNEPNYINYTGKYIVSNSNITISKYEGEQSFFICRANINCFRGNISLKS